MGKMSDYKKDTVAFCNWCDYSACRKPKKKKKSYKCSVYKKYVKLFKRRKDDKLPNE